MQEEIIEEMLFYCWVRNLTIMPEDPEAYFEKIDHNWLEIFEGVRIYAYDLMEVFYDERKETVMENR